MGQLWKSKVSMPTQMGKASLAFKSSVGVRGLALVGPEVVCPTGEQITNGGFEAGDFTGWSKGPYSFYNWVNTVNPYEGTYHCILAGYGWISQDLANEVLQSCFTADPHSNPFVFCWSMPQPGYGTLNVQFRVTLTYTDDSTTTIDFDETSSDGGGYTSYNDENLKPYVEAGKTLKSIKIERLGGQTDVHIDGVTCDV